MHALNVNTKPIIKFTIKLSANRLIQVQERVKNHINAQIADTQKYIHTQSLKKLKPHLQAPVRHHLHGVAEAHHGAEEVPEGVVQEAVGSCKLINVIK